MTNNMLIMMIIIVIRMIKMMMTSINEASVKCFLFKKSYKDTVIIIICIE